MGRWLLLLLSLAGLALMFFGPSAAWVGIGVAAFLIGSIATTLAFAHARIASDARMEDQALLHPGHRPSPSSGAQPEPSRDRDRD